MLSKLCECENGHGPGAAGGFGFDRGCMDATWRGRNGDGGVKTMGQLDNGTAVNQTRIRVDPSLFPNRILKPVGWT